jgi:hypothetical protein
MAGAEGLDLGLRPTRLSWSPGFGRLSATGARVRIPDTKQGRQTDH